ncbi:hypothetical protein KKG85_02755, partial [Patescibacteria group bacterium]|nr:hypothetical protein [Patescibacteria group bacterium]
MLNQLKQKALQEIRQAKDIKALEEIYRQYFGRKGELTEILRSLKDLTEEERKEKGRLANQIKKELEEAINNELRCSPIRSSMPGLPIQWSARPAMRWAHIRTRSA